MRPSLVSLALLVAVPALAQIEEVVITATPLQESALQTAQPAAVLAGDELTSRRAPSLGETLELQPGLSAAYFGPQASRPLVRGLGGERVQVHVDGGSALDVAALSGDHAVTVDPLLAERIEVIRGPATLLHGNSASAGLVNVLTGRLPTRPPERSLAGALELRGDSALEERALALRLDGGASRFAFHADAFGRDTDDVSIPGFAWSQALRARQLAAGEPADERRGRLASSGSRTRGGAVGGTLLGKQGHAGLAVSRFETAYGIPSIEPDEAGASIDMAQTRYDLDAERRAPLPGVRSLRARASYNDYAHRELEPDGAVGTRFFQEGLEMQLALEHLAIHGWRGTLGAQWRSLDFRAHGEEAFVPASRTRNLGAFLFEERPFGPLTLELGARFERQDIEPDTDLAAYGAHAWSASAGLLWQPLADYSLALQLTSMERHPTATELYAQGPHLAVRRFEIGDAALGREDAITADLTLRKLAGSWQFALTAFRSDYAGFILPSLTGEMQDELPVARYLQQDARLAGFEAEIVLPALQGAAGRLGARLLLDAVRGELAGGGHLPQLPPLRAGVVVGFERGDLGVDLTLMRYAAQSRVAAHELPTEAYTRLDIELSRRVPLERGELLLFVSGRNLLDEEGRRHVSALKDFAPLPGRSAAAGLRLVF